MWAQQATAGSIFFGNFIALSIGALLSFLLTSWRSRLTWIDWSIALLLNVPAASFWTKFVSVSSFDCEMYCYLMIFGGPGVGIGLLCGLLCSKLVIGSIPKTPD
jgi:hypothetical protein